MTNEFLQTYNFVDSNWCATCDQNGEGCEYCGITELKRQLKELDSNFILKSNNTSGCSYCADKNGRPRDIFFLDKTNNLRPSNFCPECGRPLCQK